jgi:hypothetical protein
MTDATYNADINIDMDDDINNEKTLDYYSNHFNTILKDIDNHKAMMKNNNIEIGDEILEENYKNLDKKINNFYKLIENDVNMELETYEKNYMLLYNIYANDITNYKGNSTNTTEEQSKMLNKRKAYYTSQELYKRNNGIYYFQGLYLVIYVVFLIECLRSSVVGLIGKIVLIMFFGLLPYLVYHVAIPWYYHYQINSDKYNVIKNVHIDE